MYHTLVGYIFNIFSTFIRMDKNPHTVRKLKIENTISPKEVKVGTIMAKSLMDQLLLCTTTSSRQVIFAQPTPSYYFFFPHITTNERKRPLPTRDNNLEPTAIKKKMSGSIINKTGKRLTFPSGMEKRYCADLLDASTRCSHGDNCSFPHVFNPNG